MEKERNIDKLAGYLIKLGILAIIAGICWYFRGVLLYIILAFVISLIGLPIMKIFKKIHIKGHTIPNWILTILTLVIIFSTILFIVTQIIPVVTGIIRDAAIFSNSSLPTGNLVKNINNWVLSVFPDAGANFDIRTVLFGQMKEIVSTSSITNFISSMASTVSDIAIGLFSVLFISFFFIKDDKLFEKIISAVAPDKIESSVGRAITDIEKLLSRYFVGIIIEMFGVALLNFLGLWVITRIGFEYALGIGFIAGLLNIIPYLGPLIGEILGVILCVTLKYGMGIGLDINIWLFAIIVFAVMLCAQFIDNFLFQPLIYSQSIHATPLEIFIILLMAGHIGGIVGMIAGIPAYTVVRVIAGYFFRDRKIVKRLMPDIAINSEETNDKENHSEL